MCEKNINFLFVENIKYFNTHTEREEKVLKKNLKNINLISQRKQIKSYKKVI